MVPTGDKGGRRGRFPFAALRAYCLTRGTLRLPRTVLLGIVVFLACRLPALAASSPANPAADDRGGGSWQLLPGTGAPTPRDGHSAVWTGSQMLIWGGFGGPSVEVGDGAAFSPATNTWHPLPTNGAPSPRGLHTAVWTGADMLVWGGDASSTGSVLGNGAAYNPGAKSWRPLSLTGAPTARVGHVALWTGTRMLIWGGVAGAAGILPQDGGAYDPLTATWSSLSTAGAIGKRLGEIVVWTGTQMVIWGGSSATAGLTYFGDGAALSPGTSLPSIVARSLAHDGRYFAQTGFRIDNDAIWSYFAHRGGVATFGYPTSRTFTFQGFQVQFFQRRIVQLDEHGQARLLNLLDAGLLPYTGLNSSTVPGVDSSLLATIVDPTNQPALLKWVKDHAPDSLAGVPVNFYASFLASVPSRAAFPDGGDAALLPAIDLELWGVPTSKPLMDPNNHNFIYLRWQRGIMMYDAGCRCTQSILLVDYLKDLLLGQNMPPDLAAEGAASAFLAQYDPGAAGWVRKPGALPNTDLTNAFTAD